MTIVYLFDSFIRYGGIERILTDKMNYLAEHYGYRIIVLTYGQDGHEPIYQLSPRVHLMDVDAPIHRRYRYRGINRIFFCLKVYRQYTKRVKGVLKENKADILVATTHNFFILCALYQLRHLAKTVVESHIYGKWGELYKKKGLINSIYFNVKDSIFRRLVKKSDVLVTLTEGDCSLWSKVKDGVVIPNLLRYYPESVDSSLQEFKRIITVGRLDYQKGFDLLLEAWKDVYTHHQDWHLDIYGGGDDSEKEKLLQLCETYGMQQSVEFHEPDKNIYAQYMKSDMFVMSSRYEGFGLVLIEAMSCGIPCISFNCPYGPSDVIKDGEDGALVENGHIKELADKICWMIENKKQRKQMGQMARENVKRFLPEKIMPQWKQLFETLIVNK